MGGIGAPPPSDLAAAGAVGALVSCAGVLVTGPFFMNAFIVACAVCSWLIDGIGGMDDPLPPEGFVYAGGFVSRCLGLGAPASSFMKELIVD